MITRNISPLHFFSSPQQPTLGFSLSLSYTTLTTAMENGSAVKRKPKAELSPEERTAIINAHKSGTSQTQLAKDYRCDRRTIYRTLKRFQEEQRITSAPRSGRPRTFNDQDRKFIRLQARRHPFWTYKQLSTDVGGSPSRGTIRRILRPHGLVKRPFAEKVPGKRVLALKRLRSAWKWGLIPGEKRI